MLIPKGVRIYPGTFFLPPFPNPLQPVPLLFPSNLLAYLFFDCYNISNWFDFQIILFYNYQRISYTNKESVIQHSIPEVL